eukprot:superscaffoldBa00000123_g1803
MCTPLKTLNDSLSHRRRYMKHNFPINYTIRVHQKEVFKLSNINRMRLHVEGLDELVLQRLWFQVNQGVLKKIIRVMPERHPSRPYTAELERRFRDAEGVFVQSHPAEIQNCLEQLPRNGTLMSPDVQNELLESAASLLLCKIKAEVRETPGTYYALMADEYKGESKRELIAVCVSVERPFSTAGRIKTDLRSSISTVRLNNLALLSFEKELCDSLDYDEIQC